MRTKYCKDLTILDINKEVILCGWVNQIRNLGNLIFIDIRDITGTIQVIFNPQYYINFKKACLLRNDFCIQITGLVTLKKQKKIKNDNINYLVEIIAFQLTIFNKTLPVPLDYTKKNKEEIRFKFRYLDLRRKIMIKNLQIRHASIILVRNFLEKRKFLEIDTPILTKSTPEGASDYLVKSRLYLNKFFALPQSPQLFKQLLMISGLDKYYQIAKCFRDEDLRSDRQPEFTQIDIEVSFTTVENFKNMISNLIHNLWLSIRNISLEKFKSITYERSLLDYGTDKPDLRNPIKLINVYDLFSRDLENIFPNLNLNLNNRIILINIPKGISLIKIIHINKYIKILKKFGINHYKFINTSGINSNILQKNIFLDMNKNISILDDIIKRTKTTRQDTLLLVAGEENILNAGISIIREKIGIDLNIIDQKKFCPVWITDFPMFKINENNKIESVHHPFTAPKSSINYISIKNSLNILSSAFDLVINGYEIGGGSSRIHDYNLQVNVFNLLNITKNQQKKHFGFFLKALQYGAPPHIGMALGLDRIVMLLTNNTTIKDVIAFPKTHSATCLMTGAPNKIYY
ncbi:aspartyl-tRNA synthetase [Buchnera aphidicola (Cinara tujafilina)]|uniref:Aspartate--tRNA ligase n=1 Tax=Buchnera aphidicola (Cinara tujafilina) TaxID=261317 RepID=F7WZC9_9GAMM|nr:aspartate--tRNA ligase [Buchnera aphidicola]AEH39791.1 aspartyl-tRNA synthetase [Buchnera aphidicola (Cinara tujafilina)]